MSHSHDQRQSPGRRMAERVEVYTEHYQIALAAETVGLPERQVRRYVRIGLVPSTTREREAYIDEAGLARLRKIRRLSEDVGLNTVGIEVVMRLLDQIDDLQRQIDRQRRP
jgi:MerR family transcriptional regulator/heat shock protein HspR